MHDYVTMNYAIKPSCNDHYYKATVIIIFLMILIALTPVVAEFWRPDVDGDEAKPRVFDGVPVFPLHLSQNSGRSVPHHINYSPFLLFLIWRKCKHTNTRRGVLCPTPPSGLPIWSSAPPWDHNQWVSRTSRPNRWIFQPLGTGEQLDGVLREPLPRNVLPHRPLLRLPGRLGLLRCRSSENSSSTNAAENEGSVQCG